MKLPWQKKTAEDGTESVEVSLPKEIDEKLNKALEGQSKIDALVTGLNSINARFTKEDEEKAAAAAAAARKNQQDNQVAEDEELEQLIVSDPRAAVNKITQGQQKVLAQLRADNLRRETFEDMERFPYYTGELKAEIDDLLSKQPLVAQNDRAVIENCYFSLVGRKEAQIREGKLKSRFAAPNGGNKGVSGTGTDGGGPGEAFEINDDVRKAARVYGTTPEKYVEMLKEAGVGYV